ncbi:MAG TPA: DNA gyrase subunit A [Candidatus Polarisedimenticolia bacterium]|nr:DNA gyrase subunit A [Candidatus Polarisedimenticolia bacterium]
MEEKLDRIVPVDIEDEMSKSYLDYAMSVIIGRALPDVRDGLKPVHRRVLYAMHDLGNDHTKPYKKSARIAGDVIGKYHPHGEAPVYDAIVRMAQEFSLRYPLIDGQGNFGSVDGDPPAAMRYTEVRMARLTSEMLRDLEKETVDFVPNYDGTLEEPLVLPAAIPNLLANGADGIAVGMATKIPPHNLRELVEGLLLIIENPRCTLQDLMQHIQGPDFPTAGLIYGLDGIRSAYATGRGTVVMRARAHVEQAQRKGFERIVITEIPYQVNKARLIEHIAQLVRDKRVDGIADIRDESDREGMRIVLDLKRDEPAQPILNYLFKFTQMQDTFGVILLAIVNNQPRVLSLREMLDAFLSHRKEVVYRRIQFDLRKAQDRAHILEGLKIALDHLDEVIATIRAAASPQVAKEQLRFKLKLTDVQAQAILDMRLQRLTGLERQKILDELTEVLALIARLKEILGSEKLVLSIISGELRAVRDTYGDDRRTEIVGQVEEISVEDMIAEEDMVVTVSHSGYIKRTPLDIYRTQGRGGKGRIGMTTRDEDFVEHLFVASTHSYILIFTNKGRLHWLKVHEIPQVGAAARGKALVNFVKLDEGEEFRAVLPVKDFEDGKFVTMATRQGVVKKTELKAFANVRSHGIIALSIDAGDDLLAARLTDGSQDIILATRDGKIIRFPEDDVRPMGRAARGVRGIKLRTNDDVVEMDTLAGATHILTATENGYGKRTEVGLYRKQSRGGMGIIDIKTTARNGKVVGVKAVGEEDQIMLSTTSGMVARMRVKRISVVGRNTQGVRLMVLEAGDKIASAAKVVERGDDAGPEIAPPEPTAEELAQLEKESKEEETP